MPPSGGAGHRFVLDPGERKADTTSEAQQERIRRCMLLSTLRAANVKRGSEDHDGQSVPNYEYIDNRQVITGRSLPNRFM